MSGPEGPEPPAPSDLDDLGPELRALLDAERERPMPDAARLRLRDRLDAATGGSLSGPPDGGGSGGSPATTGQGAAGAARAGGFAVRRLLFGLSTFAAGAMTGAIGHSLVTERPQPVALQLLEATPAPAVAPKALSIPLDHPHLPPPSTDEGTLLERHARAAPPAALAPSAVAFETPPSRDADLAAERALLDIAHTAIARGDSKGTLEALARHARQFPAGRMAEERESLYVQALVQAARYADARERAARFHKHFPGSLLRPAVDAALAAIP